jgi:hypothetical protein
MLAFMPIKNNEYVMIYLSPHPEHWLPKGRRLLRVGACRSGCERNKNMYSLKLLYYPQGVLLSWEDR